MKLYVWQGKNISDAYHDDGTLVVLAESVEQAREVARSSADGIKRTYADDEPQAWYDRNEYGDTINKPVDEAIDREPEFTFDLETPRVVAFNGGGYD